MTGAFVQMSNDGMMMTKGMNKHDKRVMMKLEADCPSQLSVERA
jgi:hypothetical protein